MIRKYIGCNLSFKCNNYSAYTPCLRKPAHRFLRKPVCFDSKKKILSERIFNIIKKATRPITGGQLE